MDAVQFSVAYNGEAVRDGLMNADDLAAALVALHRLIQTANAEINGHDSPPLNSRSALSSSISVSEFTLTLTDF